MLRIAAVIIIVDGIITAIGGKQLQRRLAQTLPELLKSGPETLLELPEETLRLGGLLQALAGAGLLAMAVNRRRND